MNERGYLHHLRGAAIPAACILLVAFFAYHALAGRSGVLALGGYKAEQARLEAEAERLAARRAALEQKVALLAPSKVDPDFAEELVRRDLGVVRPDEVVVRLDD